MLSITLHGTHINETGLYFEKTEGSPFFMNRENYAMFLHFRQTACIKGLVKDN